MHGRLAVGSALATPRPGSWLPPGQVIGPPGDPVATATIRIMLPSSRRYPAIAGNIRLLVTEATYGNRVDR